MHEYRRIAARRETKSERNPFRVTASRFDIRTIEVFAPRRRRREVQHMDIRDWIDFLRMELKREEGQTMAEYGVVLAVITLGVIAAITALALAITNKLGAVSALLK
jgi:Flp pilus assembly pilin Flp